MPCLRLSRGMAKDIMTTDGCGIRRSVLAALIKAHPKAGRILVGAAFASARIVAGGIRSGDGAQHVDVKSRGECSGDGAPAVAGETAATDSRDGAPAVATAGAGLAQMRIGAGNPRHADALPRCLAADTPEYSGSAHLFSLYAEPSQM